jgi:septal ring factor EnvC (AmiA/AmiB activator)
MLKKVKLNPVGVLLFVLVVALLIIILNQGKANDRLQADIVSIGNVLNQNDIALEAQSNELNVRADAIAGLEAEIEAINTRLNNVDSERGNLETDKVNLELAVGDLENSVANLLDELDTRSGDLQLTINALEDARANPDCPTCPECPTVETTVTE